MGCRLVLFLEVCYALFFLVVFGLKGEKLKGKLEIKKVSEKSKWQYYVI